MSITYVANTGRILEKPLVAQDEKSLLLSVIALTEGYLEDSSGKKLEITKELLQKLHDNYNSKIIETALAYNVPPKDVEGKAVAKNHKLDDVENNAGFIVGLLTLKDIGGVLSLIANLSIRGTKNVELVMLGTCDKVSVSFTLEDAELIEISFVTYGADTRAKVINKDRVTLSAPINNQQAIILNKINNLIDNEQCIAILQKKIKDKEDDLALEELKIRLCLSNKMTMANATRFTKQLKGHNLNKCVMEAIYNAIPTMKEDKIYIQDLHLQKNLTKRG